MQVTQILLFQDQDISRELGGALWAALQEVADFYGAPEFDLEFRRFYMATFPGADVTPESLLDPPSRIWEKSTGQQSYPTYEHYEIATAVHESLPSQARGVSVPEGGLLIVTDLWLKPPQEFRYIIWNTGYVGGERYGVVSLAPLDPYYWSIEDPNRLSIVKHRVRSACMAVVGDLAGLQRCDNPTCFMYKQVDSAVNLDQMVLLGSEHEITSLEEKGFEVLSEEPSREQQIMESPIPLEGEFFA